MRWFLIFIALQLAVSVILIANSHTNRKVLGVSYLAQEENTSTPSSIDNSPPPQGDQPIPNQPETTETPQSPSDITFPPAETQQNASENFPTEAPVEQQGQSSGSHNLEQSTNSNVEKKPEESLLQSGLPQSAFSPAENLTSSANVNQDSINEAEKENEQLQKTLAPEQQTTLLLGFAADKIGDIDKFLRTDDFASTSFATLRLTEEITKTQSVLQRVSVLRKQELSNQLRNLCSRADETLRSAEISVPEQSEQDIEITRGTCLNNQ